VTITQRKRPSFVSPIALLRQFFGVRWETMLLLLMPNFGEWGGNKKEVIVFAI
jgi:hypothetical protein